MGHTTSRIPELDEALEDIRMAYKEQAFDGAECTDAEMAIHLRPLLTRCFQKHRRAMTSSDSTAGPYTHQQLNRLAFSALKHQRTCQFLLFFKRALPLDHTDAVSAFVELATK